MDLLIITTFSFAITRIYHHRILELEFRYLFSLCNNFLITMIIIERFEWNIKYRIKILVASNYICNEGLDK